MVRLIWKRREAVIEGARFRSVPDAQAHAERYFPMKQKECGIDRVEVRDDDGTLRFCLPKASTRPVRERCD